ncbi:Testican-2 [Halotydeus destructor]|nr:Testican-2 [Halotydeus destructor]
MRPAMELRKCLFLILVLYTVNVDIAGAKLSRRQSKVTEKRTEALDVSNDLADDSDYDDEDFDFDDERDAKDDNLGKTLKELYFAWSNIDLCRGVQCKPHEHCVVEEKGVAACISNGKSKKGKAEHREKSTYKKGHSDKHSDERKNQNRYFKPTENTVTRKQKKACESCPVVKPDFICGSDNSTYSSHCRLKYHNCVHSTAIEVQCTGFCPCKARSSKASSRWDDKTESKDKTATGVKKQKPSKSNSIEHNSIFQSHAESKVSEQHHTCSKDELDDMGRRLLDWFFVLLNDVKRKYTQKKRQSKVFKLPDCKKEIAWMFHHLDTDGDLRLSLKELFDLEHDKHEKCLKQYIDNCDEDRDTFLNPYEWCTCFDRTSKPCKASVSHAKKALLGAYIPQCDDNGFFFATQCHASTGVCWCVDKNGVEFTNTRRRGKPDCDGMLNRSKQKVGSDDEDDDSNSDDDDLEGSGDQLN